MYSLQIREIDHRVTVGVSTAHVERSYLNTTQIDCGLICKNDSRRCVLVAPHHIVSGILVSNDLSEVDVLHVATSVVAVMMAVDDVFDRLIAYLADQFLNLIKKPYT